MNDIFGYRFYTDKYGRQILQVQKYMNGTWQYAWFDASEDEAKALIETMQSFVK